MQEFWIPSQGGGRLHCGLWEPTGTPRAVVHLVHGIAEHIARYADFACFLAENGMVVVADDHMGHGKSVAAGAPAGYFSGGWLAAVADEQTLFQRTAARYPGVPYVLFGHSMGSFLTRSYLWRYPKSPLAGVVLSGTGWQPAPVLAVGKALCRHEEKKRTEQVSSDLLQTVMFGAYNRKFSPVRTENDWICTDAAVVDAYCADPLCGFKPTIGLVRDMLGGIGLNQKRENLKAMNKELPILVFSGAKDPVGDMGRGVLKTVKAFEKAGMRQVRCTLYPEGRHEMLNEPNHLQVYADVLRWLVDTLPPAADRPAQPKK